ncbi:MAG: CBS domain-containing protein [Proteobacteria bacterium]|nr:CBS domain-containing protein [Desulfocapsa sp.]MBU3943276.1 CBS domain-containing protein [Pseudomonadota bacterium]MCG2744444.1 CBS domain-containing protein [Desulfobacteraceae bacterium]MBU3984636.1 CBS domain-containing protein [Pseudomonadota bacterium]MBU4027751.1 CBS domain-containing protein [Pseudomonadota bacterium]
MAENFPLVRDVTILLDRYPHLNEHQTLQDAITEIHSFAVGEKERIRYSSLLIVNDSNQLVGKVTLNDLLHGLVPRLVEATKVEKFEGKGSEFSNLAILMEDSFFSNCKQQSQKKISEFMSKIPLMITADSPLLEALVMMLNTENTILPVVDEDKIIGVVCMEELFTAITSQCAL